MKNKKNYIGLSALLALCAASMVFIGFFNDKPVGYDNEEALGASHYKGAKWAVVSQFDGYQTKLDPSKVSNGANPQGQNTSVNNGDRISIRNMGYETFPTGDASTTMERITSLHTFRLRDGENIMIRSRGTIMEYFDEDNDTWTTLRTGLTSNKTFDYADFNVNTDLQSYSYFGNAYDDFARWTGNHSLLNGALAVDDSYVIVDDISGFILGADTIIVCGVELAYTSASTTLNRFTLTASSTVACADNKGVAEAVETYASNPKGNIYLVNDNRLFISGIASTSQAVFFSEYGVATTFLNNLITDATDTSAGIFNFGEGGGAVIGMAADEGSIYFFKRSTVRKATLSDSLYTLGNLKPFDSKSQTIGAVNSNSIFTGSNNVFFITPDYQILSLGRVESVDYPQINRISDIIRPTVADFNFDESAGIVFKNKAYFSAKSTTEMTTNDVVLVFNLETKAWSAPIIGWNVFDFGIYDDGTSEELYFADAISPNVYKVIDEAQDGEFGVTGNWRSKQFSFGLPHAQKEILGMFVDGYISQNTTLEISLLLDEEGFSQTFNTSITGSDDDIIYSSTAYNTMGLSAFGVERFGSQSDLSGAKKFRVYFSEMRAQPFYNCTVDFASDGENQNWEILNFGFLQREYTTPEKRSLFVPFR